MTATSIDLSQIRTDAIASAATFRTLIDVYSESEVDALIGGGGVTDHGALTGLADDDHTQYALADGSRGAFVKGSLGANDNRIVRVDGTGGSTVQSTGITVNDSNNVSGVGTLGCGAITSSGAIQSVSLNATSHIDIGSGNSTRLFNVGGSGSASLRVTDAVAGTTGYTLRPDGGNGMQVYNAANNAVGNLTAAAITATGLMCAGVYTFATVPTASSNTGKFLRISDRAQKHAYSDGTNWRFFVDDAIIS